MKQRHWRTIAVAAAAVLLMGGAWVYMSYVGRLVQVGDLRIDPHVEIDPKRAYHLVVWEHEVPLPWDNGAHSQALKDAVAEFQSVWPNVHVDLKVLPWYQGHGRLREMIAQGEPPDVYGMIMGARRLDPGWQIPLDGFQSDASKADLLESAARSLSDEGGMWAWPRWVAPKVWVAREDLTPQLNEGRTRWTTERFFEVLTDAKTKSGAWGLAANPYDSALFMEVMVTSTGKNLIGPNGRRAWSTEEMAEALEFFQKLLELDLIGEDPKSMSRTRLARFWTKKTALVAPANPWLLRHLMTRGGVLDLSDEVPDQARHLALAVPPPTLADNGAFHPAMIAGYAVFRQEPYKGDDHTKAAMALAEHLSRRLGPWEAAQLFAVPAHPSSWESWRKDAGLPEKELDLLTEWAHLAVGPPLDDRQAELQERALEDIVAEEFLKLWDGGDPAAIAENIVRSLDGLRAELGNP